MHALRANKGSRSRQTRLVKDYKVIYIPICNGISMKTATYLGLEQFIIDNKQLLHRDTNLQHHLIHKLHSPAILARVLLHKLNNVLQGEESFTTSISDTQRNQLASNTLLLCLRTTSGTKLCDIKNNQTR